MNAARGLKSDGAAELERGIERSGHRLAAGNNPSGRNTRITAIIM